MDFQHSQASHCESGVMSNLLRHHGLPLSEPMTFGLSSALSFAYLPIIKINGLPLVAYRMPPKAIIKGLQKPLGLKMRFETFSSQAAGVARLNELLDQGKLVGLQTSVFWLPYLPEDLRFHFNAHNVLAFGREPGERRLPALRPGCRNDRHLRPGRPAARPVRQGCPGTQGPALLPGRHATHA